MNSILSYLGQNWQRLGLQPYGSPQQMTSLVVTPRFHASSHVVFLILRKNRPQPLLVAKVPRLAGEGETLVREAANLRAVQTSRPGGFDTLPHVIAFERHWDRPILVETALVGQPLDPPTVRGAMASSCQTVVNWLVEVQTATRSTSNAHPDWYQRLIATPLSYLEEQISLSAGEREQLQRTRRLAERLRTLDMPLVVEHGDLSHPNLMLLSGERAGVVDWELADVNGLPACDLFFFLTYAAFARHKARENGRYVEAFHEAFFGPDTWVQPYVRQYAERLALPRQALLPLFLLTWVRYLVGLLARLDLALPTEQVDEATVTWLRQNRYYALWQHAVEHLEEVAWSAQS